MTKQSDVDAGTITDLREKLDAANKKNAELRAEVNLLTARQVGLRMTLETVTRICNRHLFALDHPAL